MTDGPVQQKEIIAHHRVDMAEGLDKWRLLEYELIGSCRALAAIDNFGVEVHELYKPIDGSEAVCFAAWIAEPIQTDSSCKSWWVHILEVDHCLH